MNAVAPLGALLLTLGLASPPASAAPLGCGEVEFGLGWLDGGFGRGALVGMDGRDGYGVLRLHACSAAGRNDGRYAVLRGEQLGTGSRQVYARLGQQGRYRIELDHRRIPSTVTIGRTPLRSADDGALVLPDGWVAAPTTTGMEALPAALRPVELANTRRSSAIGARVRLPEPWTLETRYRQQRRDGRSVFGGLFGSTGGNARAIQLPVAIDTTSRDYEASLRYTDPARHWRIGWRLSQFDNAIDRWQWQNPFAGVTGWPPVAGFPAFGQAQPAPDNRFQQLQLATAHSLGAHLRLLGDIAIGRMEQDQPFLPYSSVAELAATIADPLPRGSLRGRIDTRLVDLKLQSLRPQAWHWTATLRHDLRDNRTPTDAFVAISGDAQAQDTDPASGQRRYNLAYDYRSDRLALQASRRFQSGLAIDLDGNHERIRRSFSARDETRESQIAAGVRAQPRDDLETHVRLALSDRDGSAWLGSRAFVASHSEAYVDSVPGGFENLPGLRPFPLADRRRWQASGSAATTRFAPLDVALQFALLRDDYARSEFGLTESRLGNATLELGWARGGWNWHGYAGREWMHFDQDGRSFLGGAVRLPQAQDPARNWRAEHADRVDSLGLGLSYAPADGRWRLDAGVSRNDARGEIEVGTGPALTSAPLPDTRARLISAELRWQRRLSARSTVLLEWRHERFDGSDWASDDSGPQTLANVILLGEQQPDYRAHAVALSLRWQFAE